MKKSTKISKLRMPTPDGRIGTVTLGTGRPPTTDHAATVWGTRYGDCNHTAVAIGGAQYAIHGTMPAPKATTRTTHLIVRLTANEAQHAE